MLLNFSLLKQVRAEFGAKMADELSAEDLQRFAVRRQKDGYRNASTNRIFECLRRAYHLKELKPPKIAKLYEKDNVRKGFFSREQMDKVLSYLSDDGLRDYVRFAWCTGLRKGELSALRWSFIDGEEINIPGEFCKSDEAHNIPLAGRLKAIIERRKAERMFRSDGMVKLSEFIFHRGDGLPILEFRQSWKTACAKAGVGNMHFHDLRRSAARDMIKLGISQKVAMEITGHKTISMFMRYNVTAKEDRSRALQQMSEVRSA